MSTTNTTTLWAIAYRKWWRGHKHEFGLYTGTWQTRKDAISAHTAGKGKDWRYCVRNGDRAVKVIMTFPSPD